MKDYEENFVYKQIVIRWKAWLTYLHIYISTYL